MLGLLSLCLWTLNSFSLKRGCKSNTLFLIQQVKFCNKFNENNTFLKVIKLRSENKFSNPVFGYWPQHVYERIVKTSGKCKLFFYTVKQLCKKNMLTVVNVYKKQRNSNIRQFYLRVIIPGWTQACFLTTGFRYSNTLLLQKVSNRLLFLICFEE